MLRQGRRVGIAVAVALACALQPAAAHAGEVVGDLQLTYTETTEGWPSVPGRNSQSTYDACSGTQRLAGIGGAIREGIPTVPDHAGFALGKAFHVGISFEDQYPGAPAPDSNLQVADNLFAVDNGLVMNETTVCAETPAALSYPQSDRRTAKRARTSAKVSCGARQVLSGGGLASGPFRSQRLVASAPFDSGDPGAKPDDGWRVAVDNLTRKRRKVTAYAICSDATGITYESDPFRARKRERKHVEVDCPDGETALGGGVTHTIRAGRATLVASRYRPFPGYDGWLTEVDNLSRKRSSGRAFAICHA